MLFELGASVKPFETTMISNKVSLHAICAIGFVMLVAIQNCVVLGGPLQQENTELVEEGRYDTVVMLQRELIQNLTKRVDELERMIKGSLLDQKYQVVPIPRSRRRKRTISESQRGDTNANESNTEQGGQVNLNPYWIGQCMLCPTGPPGPPGPEGPQGVPGRDGRDGRDATSGYPMAGDTENDHAQQPTAEPVSVSDWYHHDNTSSGVIYTRWGRTQCPPSAELVYEGIAGGAHYTHTGSGSNYLCLPLEPIYDRPWPGNQGEAGAFIYGAEYQTGNFAPFSGLHDHEVPCAVCRAPSRTSLLMLPARNECPDSSWTAEYTGWLVAANHGHKKSEFNCMDKEPEAVPRTATNQDGALFYLVEGRCVSNGGLPCGPYVQGYELTCAVCTR